jgi:cbb3-type cytochrome oxidase subunit 1
VALVASAYTWAIVGGALLVIDGIAGVLDLGAPFSLDAARHSLAIGFIALLICGIAPRMVPGFSGGHILSAKLVTATLWLGNSAAILRVGSLLIAPLLDALGPSGAFVDSLLFGLSGPLGLALAICLAVNLWPALFPKNPR